MPTRNQIIAIQKARRALALSDAQYRMILRNTGRVESSKDLDNRGVEDVMAVLEDMGFDSHPGGKNYWRDKVARRNGAAGERQIDLIRRLSEGHRYSLDALVMRFSGGRTDEVEKLAPREAWQLIEMLKASGKREHQARRLDAQQILPF